MKNLKQIWLAVLAAALITFLTNSIPASGQNAGQGQSSPPNFRRGNAKQATGRHCRCEEVLGGTYARDAGSGQRV